MKFTLLLMIAYKIFRTLMAINIFSFISFAQTELIDFAQPIYVW